MTILHRNAPADLFGRSPQVRTIDKRRSVTRELEHNAIPHAAIICRVISIDRRKIRGWSVPSGVGIPVLHGNGESVVIAAPSHKRAVDQRLAINSKLRHEDVPSIWHRCAWSHRH